ncbi:hypothetical protein [Arthrobacter sp. yr096]|uniref:hypothetical protein n=1 Tax=Arthrobacter sp. yr096 TaxID=1761750 RepID=UPI00115FD96D|nr:hypothetical protein [Arthrobacter sp. yr096]
MHRPHIVMPDGAEGELNRGEIEPLDALAIESLNATTDFLMTVVEEGGALTWLLRELECWNGKLVGSQDA